MRDHDSIIIDDRDALDFSDSSNTLADEDEDEEARIAALEREHGRLIAAIQDIARNVKRVLPADVSWVPKIDRMNREHRSR